MIARSQIGPIKLYGLLQRRLDLSLAAFSSHWQTTHLTEALKLSKFYSAYVQNHRIDIDLPGYPAVCDGVPELWFRAPEHVVAMRQSQEYETGAYVDEPNFMQGRAAGFVGSERVLLAGPVKLTDEKCVRTMLFVRRRHDLQEDPFVEWCRSYTDPIINLSTKPIRHVRAIAFPGSELPVYDAIESCWWTDAEHAIRAWGAGTMMPEAQDYIDTRSCGLLVCREEFVSWPDTGVDYNR